MDANFLQIGKSFALSSFLGVCLIFAWGCVQLYSNRKKNLLHVPGPTPLPILGNALYLMGPHEEFMDKVWTLRRQYGPNFRLHLGTRPNLVISSPEAYEKILSSNKQITKGLDYTFLWSWLGKGLLTSTGQKWHSRRKMLTPAFHFKILEDFMQVMNQQCKILCDKLEEKTNEEEFNVYPMVTHCALDIICETAMGKKLNSQENSNTPYVEALYKSADFVFSRQTSPWLWKDWIFNLTKDGVEAKKCLKILHGFTNEVIQERKEEMKNEDMEDVEDDVGRKKRIAFLDLLIRESKGGTLLSDDDIREEVDTFMFEGHDTTACNMTFTLFLMASHQAAQKQCQQELDSIFEGSDRDATSEDLANMKYLESCLKESLRMYQSVPMMSRITGEDVEIDGHLIPANTNIVMVSYALHRDEKSFPNPDQFDPDRFSLANNQQRHPYAYVPFSAGPRNCIGQKFAMMEEKILLSTVLRKFNLQTKMKIADIPLVAEVVLKPKNGINLIVTKR